MVTETRQQLQDKVKLYFERQHELKLSSYPAGLCIRCKSDSWAMRPDGTGYYCAVCIPELEISKRYADYL